MGRTREFGTLRYRPNKVNATRIVASFATPLSVFDEYPHVARRQSKSFPVRKKAEALAWLDQQQRLIDAGVWKPAEIVKAEQLGKTMTVDEYFPQWLQERRTAKGEPLRATTLYRIRKDYENHIRPYWATTRLAAITQQDIDQWLDTLPAGQHSMRVNVFKVLRAMLHSAAKPGDDGSPALIKADPCTHGVARRKREHEIIPASMQEVKTIYDNMPEAYRMSVYLAVFADGLRIGEVCALQRGDIDLNSRLLHVRRARLAVGAQLVGEPKTSNSYRTCQLPSQLMPLLAEFLNKHVGKAQDAWLFPENGDTSKPLHQNTLRYWYMIAREKAGRPDLRFHDLRHTALTWLAQDGATVRELMDAAGHADVSMAMRYQHSVDERRKQQADKLGMRLIATDTSLTKQRLEDIQQQLEDLKAERLQLLQQLHA